MEIINFLFEREEYVKYNLLQLEKDNQLLLVKNKNEMCMIEFYIKKYDLIMNKEVIEKLSRFNGYLTLLEEHCIKNKEVYKEFIKIMSTFNVRKIFLFIERLDLIIQKGFNKEIYYNSFIIDEINNVLFFSITKEKYELDFIKFIGTLFMCKYNLLDLLIVISFAIDESNYELDFFIISYDVDDLEFYKKEYNNYYEELWNNKIIDKVWFIIEFIEGSNKYEKSNWIII